MTRNPVTNIHPRGAATLNRAGSTGTYIHLRRQARGKASTWWPAERPPLLTGVCASPWPYLTGSQNKRPLTPQHRCGQATPTFNTHTLIGRSVVKSPPPVVFGGGEGSVCLGLVTGDGLRVDSVVGRVGAARSLQFTCHEAGCLVHPAGGHRMRHYGNVPPGSTRRTSPPPYLHELDTMKRLPAHGEKQSPWQQ